MADEPLPSALVQVQDENGLTFRTTYKAFKKVWEPRGRKLAETTTETATVDPKDEDNPDLAPPANPSEED